MLDFGALPPEINSGRMYSGPGSGPMMAGAAAWDALAAELDSTAAGSMSVVSELTTSPWLGPASGSMVAAATPYIDWIRSAATLAEETGNQAPGRRGSLRNRIRIDRASGGRHCQPAVVDDVDC